MGFAIDLWQNPYTMAKLMIYGFCHVMGFPIVPWQNPWILWNVTSMGFAMAHYSMGFPMEHSKENCHCVFNQPGIFFCIASNCCQVLVVRLRFSFWYGKGPATLKGLVKLWWICELRTLLGVQMNSKVDHNPPANWDWWTYIFYGITLAIYGWK